MSVVFGHPINISHVTSLLIMSISHTSHGKHNIFVKWKTYYVYTMTHDGIKEPFSC